MHPHLNYPCFLPSLLFSLRLFPLPFLFQFLHRLHQRRTTLTLKKFFKPLHCLIALKNQSLPHKYCRCSRQSFRRWPIHHLQDHPWVIHLRHLHPWDIPRLQHPPWVTHRLHHHLWVIQQLVLLLWDIHLKETNQREVQTWDIQQWEHQLSLLQLM